MDKQLKDLWESIGRGGAKKLRDAARRAGLQTSLKEAEEFVKKQAETQVFARAPQSKGRIVAPRRGARVQLDLIDQKGNPADGKTAILVATDVFSRELWAEALPSKRADVVADAFARILGKMGGRRRSKGAQDLPYEVSHDKGLEFTGAFQTLLEEKGIASTSKTHENSLAIVDAGIKGLKDVMKRQMTATGDTWVEALPKAVKAHNESSHSGIMHARPVDVRKSNLLQYALERRAGEGVAQNHDIARKRFDALADAGAFRKLLPRSTWVRTNTPRWSAQVFKVQSFEGGVVVATDGSRTAIRDTLAVDTDSREVALPARPTRVRTDAAEALEPYAAALEGMLGRGSLTIQGVGTKLRGVPGFEQAMATSRIAGNGSMSRFLGLYPQKFVVEGVAPKQLVRRA